MFMFPAENASFAEHLWDFQFFLKDIAFAYYVDLMNKTVEPL